MSFIKNGKYTFNTDTDYINISTKELIRIDKFDGWQRKPFDNFDITFKKSKENVNMKTQEEICLFDSLHDFGKYSICYDIIRSLDENNQIIDKLVFTMLRQFCFNIDNIKLSSNFSNLKTPRFSIPSSLTTSEL